MRKPLVWLLLFAISGFSAHVFANVRLPAVIASHMVLQQRSQVKIWGWCDVGELVQLKAGWDTTTFSVKGSTSAKWEIDIPTPGAGGPFQISIHGQNTIVLNDVMIGEVWLCSGQSNMEMNVNWGLPYQEDVQNANDTFIRLFNIPRTTADYPQDDCRSEWMLCSPDVMRSFSAIGYFFAKRLREELKVPVGIMCSSWGGTPAEVWTPSDAIASDAVLKEAAAKQTPVPWGPVYPAATYNAMIYPITKFTIAGALWYQGEANVNAYGNYSRLLSTMISAWRKAWQKEFPFYYVQIAPFAGYGNNDSSARLREAQTSVLRVANTGMVVITDLVDNIKDIHPKMKKEVAARLANYALSETYHKEHITYKSPVYKRLKVEENKLRIFFDNVPNGLVSEGDTLQEFYVAGIDQKFAPAVGRIDGNTVVVWSKDVPEPTAVRFAFTNGPLPNLFSKEGLPVNPFRTDTWTVQIVPDKK